MRRYFSDAPSRIAMAILSIAILAAILAPVIATDRALLLRSSTGAIRVLSNEGRAIVRPPVPYDPNAIDLSRRLRPPGSEHLFGTDNLGRDVLARTIHGARVSLAIGFIAGLAALVIGAGLGLSAAMAGGWVDAAVLRLIEIALCFPFYFVALAIVAVMGPSVTTLITALVLTSWTAEARLVRGEVMKLKDGSMIEAARSSGARPASILLRHVLPNAITPAIVSAGFGIAAAIVAESALSFLGFGVPLPLSSWGSMLAAADDHLFVAWWLALFPGLAIACTVGSIQVLTERARRQIAVEAAAPPIG